MIFKKQHTKLVQTTFIFVAMLLCFEALAAKRPPGVPKKRQCNKSLSAVKVADLEFGYLDGTTGGTVTVSTSGGRTSTGPTLISGGSVNAGAYDVSNSRAGCDYYPIRIRVRRVPANLTGPGAIIPSDVYTTSPSGSFTLSPTPGIPTRVNVGATITTGGSQTEGTYTTARQYRLQFKLINP